MRAMSRAFQELFAVDDAFRGIPMPGRTDAAILAEAAAAHGIPPDSPDLARFPDIYLRYLPIELDQPGPRKGIMPGVRALLDTLSVRSDVHLSLLTGNFERAAKVKLDYFGLSRYFVGGAFGDAAPDRNTLVAQAVARAAAGGALPVRMSQVIVIGDTPLDVACAAAAGARSIAVATGSHGIADLEASGADVVVADLSDTPTVLAAIATLAEQPR